MRRTLRARPRARVNAAARTALALQLLTGCGGKLEPEYDWGLDPSLHLKDLDAAQGRTLCRKEVEASFALQTPEERCLTVATGAPDATVTEFRQTCLEYYERCMQQPDHYFEESREQLPEEQCEPPILHWGPGFGIELQGCDATVGDFVRCTTWTLNERLAGTAPVRCELAFPRPPAPDPYNDPAFEEEHCAALAPCRVQPPK